MSPRLSREARDWSLFVDWCESMETPPIPATSELIADFLTAFPAPLEAQGRRVKAIRRSHERAGVPLVLPTAEPVRAFREGAEWASVPRALAQVPKYHHPANFQAALRGRRDGWLIVLIGVLGLSRREARDLDQNDVVLYPCIAIKGKPIAKTQPPSECPACAVTRWLRVAGEASSGWTDTVKRVVGPIGLDESAHDCEVGLDGLWRQASTLLPGVDRHGWVSPEPMSRRAITAAIAFRQALGEASESRQRVSTTATGRFANATLNELAAEYDDVNRRAAAALLRLNEILEESNEMLDHIKSFTS